MTLDTPHGPITKFLKKCPKNAGNYFFPNLVFDSETKSQFRSAAKNQREISSNKVGRLLWPLGEGKFGNLLILS